VLDIARHRAEGSCYSIAVPYEPLWPARVVVDDHDRARLPAADENLLRMRIAFYSRHIEMISVI